MSATADTTSTRAPTLASTPSLAVGYPPPPSLARALSLVHLHTYTLRHVRLFSPRRHARGCVSSSSPAPLAPPFSLPLSLRQAPLPSPRRSALGPHAFTYTPTCMQPSTLNLNPKPQTVNPRPESRNPKPQPDTGAWYCYECQKRRRKADVLVAKVESGPVLSVGKSGRERKVCSRG